MMLKTPEALLLLLLTTLRTQMCPLPKTNHSERSIPEHTGWEYLSPRGHSAQGGSGLGLVWVSCSSLTSRTSPCKAQSAPPLPSASLKAHCAAPWPMSWLKHGPQRRDRNLGQTHVSPHGPLCSLPEVPACSWATSKGQDAPSTSRLHRSSGTSWTKAQRRQLGWEKSRNLGSFPSEADRVARGRNTTETPEACNQCLDRAGWPARTGRKQRSLRSAVTCLREILGLRCPRG